MVKTGWNQNGHPTGPDRLQPRLSTVEQKVPGFFSLAPVGHDGLSHDL